jgi:hypothetical protein
MALVSGVTETPIFLVKFQGDLYANADSALEGRIGSVDKELVG